MTATGAALASNRWAEAWPDAGAFALGLIVAWWWGWNTTDLVWSLWLSSLVIGYASLVWMITAPLRETAMGLASDRGAVKAMLGGKTVAVGLVGAGTLLGLAFFTVHFGGFHFVHSVFLSAFFPVTIDGRASHGFPGAAVYLEVLRRYWWFLPAAAIARRKARGDPMMGPYKNVIRMHLLIFFFALVHFARCENFAVYAVVYAVYFLPWRLLRPATARS